MTKNDPDKTDPTGYLRDQNGKFMPGTRPGPGRPPGRPNKPPPANLKALSDLAQPLDTETLHALSRKLMANQAWLREIANRFPGSIATAIQAHISVADWALLALLEQLNALATSREPDPTTTEHTTTPWETAAHLRRQEKELAEYERQLDWLEGRDPPKQKESPRDVDHPQPRRG